MTTMRMIELPEHNDAGEALKQLVERIMREEGNMTFSEAAREAARRNPALAEAWARNVRNISTSA